MKRLTCEMCGSTELVKDGGLFVCQACGCKYTVEEAKKMMVEGTVEVQGSVSIDRSSEIENRLKNAINEYSSGNNDVAYSLFSDILNIDPNNATAIAYKALCDSWNSSIQNPKLGSASSEICRAITIIRKNNDDEDAYSFACSVILIEVMKVSKAMFASLDKYKTDFQKRYDDLSRQSDRKAEEARRNTKSNLYLAQAQTNAAIQLLTQASNLRQDFEQTYAKGLMLTMDPLIKIVEVVVNNVQKPEELNPVFIDAIEKYNDSYKAYAVIDDYKNRVSKITSFCTESKTKISEKKEKEKNERIRQYWAEHPEEKERLKNELEEIEKQIIENKNKINEIAGENGSLITELNKQLKDDVPAAKERAKVRNEIRDLTNTRSKLGVFKGKEKKEISAKIDQLEEKIKQLNKDEEQQKAEQKDRVNKQLEEINKNKKPFEETIEELDKRKTEIVEELEKDR